MTITARLKKKRRKSWFIYLFSFRHSDGQELIHKHVPDKLTSEEKFCSILEDKWIAIYLNCRYDIISCFTQAW